MKSRKETVIAEIDKFSEWLFGGTSMFGAISFDATRMMIEIAGQIIFGAVIQLERSFGKKKKDIFSIIDRTAPERLTMKLSGLFSPKNCEKLCKETLGFSQVRSSIVRHCMVFSSLGCFEKEGREMVLKSKEQADREKAEGKLNAKAGQFLKGCNLGKKHTTEIYDLDIRRLLLVVAALIRRLKGEFTEYGNDPWEEFAPTHGCAMLAHLWNKVIGVGTIFGGWEDWEEVDEEARPTREESTAELQYKLAGLEQILSEDEDRLQKLKSEGRKGSPWFWQMYTKTRHEIERLRRLLAARSWAGEPL